MLLLKCMNKMLYRHLLNVTDALDLVLVDLHYKDV